MSSYVNKKSRVFMQPGSTKVIQKRSESRLKSIKSAADNRAWTDCVEDRRQYILELIRSKAGGLSLGKYIPIEVIIDCLLASKNAQIAELQRQLDAYKKLKLTDEQKRQMGLAVPEAKTSPPKPEPPKPQPVELPKPEPPKPEPPKPEPPKVEPPKPEPPKVEPPQPEAPKPEPPKVEPLKPEPPKEEPPKPKEPEAEPPKVEPVVEVPSDLPSEKVAEEDDETGTPLKSAYQKIVVGDISLADHDVASLLPESPEETEGEEDKFEETTEALDEDDVEKGQLEAMSNKEEILDDEQNLDDLNKLAEEAINQLGQIKALIDQCGLDKSRICSKPCSPCPLTMKETNDQDNKMPQAESSKKNEELEPDVPELQRSGSGSVYIQELQKRFNDMIGLEEDVQSLINLILCKDKALAHMRKELEKCRAAVSQLEIDLAKCAQLNAENEKLKERLQDLSNLEARHGEILKKLDAMEEQLKAKCQYSCEVEKESAALRNQVENDKFLKRENEMLQRQVGDLECCIADLEEEIKRLVGHIDRLTEGRDEQQAKMQNTMSDIRAELEEKTLLIQKSEEKLATVQQKLEVSIKGVSSETTCFKSRIEDLQKLVSLKDEQIAILNNNLMEKENIISDLKKTKTDIEKPAEAATIKSLKQDLENSIKQNEKLQGQLEKIVMSKKNENCMHKMLIQSGAAIKKVKEEIKRQYREWEDGAGEHTEHLDELKERIKILEAELSNMENVNKDLKESFQNQKTCNCLAGLENKALKKHSTEIQNLAKYQVQELLDNLKKAQTRIIELEELLEEEKKVNSDGEGSCLCDMEEIQRLLKENEILKKELLKEQDSLKKVESNIDQDLLNEIQRLKNEIASLESDKLKLEKENENLRTKSQFSRDANLEEELSKCRENERALKELNDSLRNQIESLKADLIACQAKIQSTSSTEKVKPDNLENENKKLKQEIDTLNKTIAELDNIKKQLAACLDREKKNNGENATENSKLKNENDTLKNSLKEMDDLKNQLAACLEKEMKSGGESEIEKTKLKSENDILKNSLSELENLKKQLAECLEREKKTGEEKTNENSKLKNENDTLRNSLKDLEKLKNELAECLKREKSSSQQQLNERNDISNENTKLKKDNDALKDQLAACLEREKTKGKSEPSKSESPKKDDKQYTELADENAKLKEQLKQLEKQLSECLERDEKLPAIDTMSNSPEDLRAEINRLLKELEKEKNDCKETIKSLKDQYDRDVKSLKNTSRLSIDKLQEQHSNQIKELESLHDSLVSSLKDELKTSQIIKVPSKTSEEKKIVLSTQNFCVCSEMPRIVPIITTLGADIGVHEVDSYAQEGQWPRPHLPADSPINRVLFKALHQGIEALSMEELKMIHAELIKTTAKHKDKLPRSLKAPLETQDPLSLMTKIDQLEDDLHKKQNSAKQKVIALHMSIRSVERRISEMRYVLDKEREHNAQLRSKLMTMEKNAQNQVGGSLARIGQMSEEESLRCTNYQCERRKQDVDRGKRRIKSSRRSSSSISTESSEQKGHIGKKRSISTPPHAGTGRYVPAQLESHPQGGRDKGTRIKKGNVSKHYSPPCSRR